jgi:Alpha-2,8-polysialyltransferase (POLYST)
VKTEDIYSYINFRTESGSPLFKISYENELSDFQRIYKKISPVFGLFETIGGSVKKKEIIFIGSGFRSLVDQLQEQCSVGVIALGAFEYIQCLKKRVSCVPFWRQLNSLIDAYYDLPNLEKSENILADLTRWLSTFHAKVLVFRSDNMIAERALIYAAKKAGIPTVVVQHGLIDLDDSVINPDCDGRFADKMLVWGDAYRDFYVRTKRKSPDDILTLGCTYQPLARLPRQSVPVCFLGQPHEKFHAEALKDKIKSITTLAAICSTRNVQLFYRPHPREDYSFLNSVPSNVKVLTSNEPLEKLLSRCSVVLSWASTALLEASLSQCVATQIQTKSLYSYNMQERGLCYSISDAPDELDSFLVAALNHRIPVWTVPEQLISQPENLAHCFMSCLDKFGIYL